MDEHKTLSDYVRQLSENPGTASLDMDQVPAKDKALAEQLLALGTYTQELWELINNMSDGHLNRELSKGNPFYAPCMQGLSCMRSLNWTVQQIAEGNYDLSVDYMGDFSSAFNTMVSQLKEREQLQQFCAQSQQEVMEDRLHAQERELKMQDEHYHQVMQMQDQLRSFRHDMRNHVVSLLALLENGQTSQAIDYIHTASNVTLDTQPVLTTGCLVLDAIVSQKSALARRYGIRMDIDVQLGGTLKLNSEEISVLFGNALDNAIEAARKCPVRSAPYIDFHLHTRSSMLTVLIRNSAVCAPRKNKDGEIVTSKRDSARHGFGLKNMQRIVDHYHGVFNRSFDNGVFSVDVLLLGAVRPKPKAKVVSLR